VLGDSLHRRQRRFQRALRGFRGFAFQSPLNFVDLRDRQNSLANQPRSHNAVAAAVAQNRADWGVAIAPVARMYGLSFLPIAPEAYDFLLRETRRERPAVAAFLAALRDETTRQRIRALGMEPAGE